MLRQSMSMLVRRLLVVAACACIMMLIVSHVPTMILLGTLGFLGYFAACGAVGYLAVTLVLRVVKFWRGRDLPDEAASLDDEDDGDVNLHDADEHFDGE